MIVPRRLPDHPSLAVLGQSYDRRLEPVQAVRRSFADQLRALPIAINALADPAILRESSAEKLDMLAADGHTGPVAIITKGNLDTPWWRERLPRWCDELDLYIFASISGLPRSYEPVPLEPRFRTLRVAREMGAKSIAYLRPIVPGVNDSPPLLEDLVVRAHAAGCHAVVSSGFRGAEPIIEDSGFKEHHDERWKNGWFPSVKLHTDSMEEYVRKLCFDRGIGFWTGTSCAVAALSGEGRSRSPYHIAPQFARCDVCPIRESCYGRRKSMRPLEGSIDLLRHLGYHVTLTPPHEGRPPCEVSIRSDCSLHCTNCTRAAEFGYPVVNVKRWNGEPPTWGDLCLARFLTGGMLCTDRELDQTEVSTIRLAPHFGLPERGAGSLYATTTWMMWSEYLPKDRCFRCSYCFVGMYRDSLPAPMQGTVGMSPVRLLDRSAPENVRDA